MLFLHLCCWGYTSTLKNLTITRWKYNNKSVNILSSTTVNTGNPAMPSKSDITSFQNAILPRQKPHTFSLLWRQYRPGNCSYNHHPGISKNSTELRVLGNSVSYFSYGYIIPLPLIFFLCM